MAKEPDYIAGVWALNLFIQALIKLDSSTSKE